MSAREKAIAMKMAARLAEGRWPEFFEAPGFTFIWLALEAVFGPTWRGLLDARRDPGTNLHLSPEQYVTEAEWIQVQEHLNGMDVKRSYVLRLLYAHIQATPVGRPPFKVWSPYPEAFTRPDQIDQFRGVAAAPIPTNYRLLPWTMQELVGSVWRNSHTAAEVTVLNVQYDRFCNPHPVKQPDHMQGLGVWREDRYCVEHWIRVDHLDVQDQLAWAKWDYKISADGIRASIRKPALARKLLTDAQVALQYFCWAHGLEFSETDLVNDIIKDSDEAGQLSLF